MWTKCPIEPAEKRERAGQPGRRTCEPFFGRVRSRRGVPTSVRGARRPAVVDPYDWLDVPKGQRPPNYYRLLGLDPSATDPAAVRAAAARQLRRLLPHL